jgi:Ca2+-transporting ATPase
VLERQPLEHDVMNRPPRDPKEKLLSPALLVKSVAQGLAIFAASFGTYVFFVQSNPANAALARTMGIAILLVSNVLLVIVNSSNTESFFHSLGHLLRDKVMIAVTFGTLLLLMIAVYTPVNAFLKLSALTITQLLLAVGLSAAAVLWYELVKLIKKRRSK